MGSLEVPSGPRLTTMSYCILGCPEYGMTNASNFKWGFTPDRNPKRGNKKMGNNIDIDLCKSANAKKIVSWPTLQCSPNMEWPMQAFQVWLCP